MIRVGRHAPAQRNTSPARPTGAGQKHRQPRDCDEQQHVRRGSSQNLPDIQAFPALNPFLRHYRGLRKILAAMAPVAGHVCYSAPVNECGTRFTFSRKLQSARPCSLNATTENSCSENPVVAASLLVPRSFRRLHLTGGLGLSRSWPVHVGVTHEHPTIR